MGDKSCSDQPFVVGQTCENVNKIKVSYLAFMDKTTLGRRVEDLK